MKEQIKRILKTSPQGRRLYSRCQRLYRIYAEPRKRRRLRRHGLAALGRLDRVLTSAGIPYVAAFGTLLGLVREGFFIPHDEDIDVAILPDAAAPARVLDLLLDDGFDFIHAFEYQHRIVLFSVRYARVPLDIYFLEPAGHRLRAYNFYWEPSHPYTSANENHARWIHQSAVAGVERMQIGAVAVPLPKNKEQVLESLYGPGWRQPDPSWNSGRHSGILDCPAKGYAVTAARVRELGTIAK